MRPAFPSFAILAVAALLSSGAGAETLYLKCGTDYPSHYVVDTDKNTVDNHPATINEALISWEQTAVIPGSPGWSQTLYLSIDRRSGTLTQYGVMSEPSGKKRRSNPPDTTMPCEKEAKPDTKF